MEGHIQIDDPTFCYFCSESMITGMEKAGVDHKALLDTYIRAINVCVQDRPVDLRVSVHLCRGNFKVCLDCDTRNYSPDNNLFFKGMHFSEGGYGRVAEKLFKNLNVDTFYVRNNKPVGHPGLVDDAFFHSSNTILNVLAISRH
jgi:methionine synthase II (cobalamin-independent)